MGWDGSGNFVLTVSVSQQASAGVGIEASMIEAIHNDFATGIDNTVAKDGQNAPTANLSMAGFKHTNVGGTSTDTQYLRAREYVKQFPIYIADNAAAGASATISGSPGFWPASASLSAGTRIQVKMSESKPSASAVAMVLKVAGSTTPIVMRDGRSSIPPVSFVSGGIHELVYDGTNYVLMDPYAGSREISLVQKLTNSSKTSVTASTATNPVAGFSRAGNAVHAMVGRFSIEVQGVTGFYIALSGVPNWAAGPASTEIGATNMFFTSVTSPSTFGATSPTLRVSNERLLMYAPDFSATWSAQRFKTNGFAVSWLVTTST